VLVPENEYPKLRGDRLQLHGMATTIPYTYFQCPCTSDLATSRRVGEPGASEGQDEAEDERNFDPRAPRSSYSLYPLEHLLFCEDCQQMRCPKCVIEEIVALYCPSCLFEVPSSTVKQDGNRCVNHEWLGQHLLKKT
jgi:dynactin 4